MRMEIGAFGAAAPSRTTVFEYDKVGRRVSQSDYDAGGALTRVFFTRYDEHGRIARILVEEGEAAPLVVYEARYDTEGRLVEEFKIPRRHGKLSGELFRMRQVRYADRWLVQRGFDEQGRLTNRTLRVFDESGELVREEQCWAAGEDPLPEAYAFRDDGTVPDFVWEGGVQWSTKEYRGVDTLLAELFIRGDGSLALDLGYEHEFDRYGNWVSCRTWKDEPEDRHFGGRFAYSDRLRREIEYHDE